MMKSPRCFTVFDDQGVVRYVEAIPGDDGQYTPPVGSHLIDLKGRDFMVGHDPDRRPSMTFADARKRHQEHLAAIFKRLLAVIEDPEFMSPEFPEYRSLRVDLDLTLNRLLSLNDAESVANRGYSYPK